MTECETGSDRLWNRSCHDLHTEAMDLSFKADQARRAGQMEESRRLNAQASERELAAARLIECDSSNLAWSITMRSAGWLAFRAGQMRTAERIACEALLKDPHEAIVNELRDLLACIYLVPDDPEEAERVIDAVRHGLDIAVAACEADPVSGTLSYQDVDYKTPRPGFIAIIGPEEDIEGYEIWVRRQYGKGLDVRDTPLPGG